jgi:HlyD family secretion protein
LIPNFLRRNAVRWLIVLGVLVLAAAFVAWSATGRKPKYVTATVSRGAIQRAVSTTGALNPVVTVNVGSYVSGTIKKLFCDYNTEVTVGQPCALVDPLPFQLIVDQDRAELGTTKAQLKKDQAALAYAKTAYERDAKLLDEGTVSADTVDSEKSSYDQAVAQVGLDQASIVQRDAALKAAQVNLDYTNIVSPVVGTVITRSIDVGQTVAASLQTPTLFIIGKDLTKMQVDTNVSEADVGGLHVGQDAYFSVQAFPGRVFHGKISQIRHGPITVQNVVTYDVVIAFDNPDRLLYPGMTADTHIVTDEHRNVLRVPLPATRFSPGGLGHASRPTPGVGREQTRGEATAESGVAVPAPEGGGEGRGPGRGQGFRRDGGDRGDRSDRTAGDHPGGGGHRGQRGATHSGRVWVLEADGKLKSVPVALGLDDGSMVEISGPGISEGDTVVVNQINENEEKRAPGPGNANANAFRPAGPRF